MEVCAADAGIYIAVSLGLALALIAMVAYHIVKMRNTQKPKPEEQGTEMTPNYSPLETA